VTSIHSVLEHLRRTALRGDVARLSDGQLLDRYVAERDEAAFEALLCRHGPMVLGVCRRILRDPTDAEDAFQASFLVLVRRARAVSPRELVGNWLYGVACHTAMKAREVAARRRARELNAATAGSGDPRRAHDPRRASDGLGQLRELLDAGLKSLPEPYRAAVVLCDLEGKSRKEVAGQLGWAEGTVASRLSRGRDLLARRLCRGGVTLSATALGGLLAEGAALARVPAPLLSSTAHAAAVYAVGGAAAGGVPGGVVALTEGVLKAMWMTKLKIAAAVVLGVSIVSAGVGHLSIATGQAPATSTAPANKLATPAAPNPAVPALIQALKDPSAEVRASAAAILAKLGTDAKDAVPALIAALKDDDAKVRAQAVEALNALTKDKQPPTATTPPRKNTDDAEFIRRIYLDTTGALPTAADMQKFLSDKTPEKRQKLIDQLIERNNYQNLWMQAFTGVRISEEERLFFAPKGNVLAIVHGHEVEVVTADSGKELRRYSLGARVTSVAFSPDARLLVIATADRKVRAYGDDGKVIWERGGAAPARERAK
jgi:RNA polymerase sigma factor (sigma-70 family)